MKKMKKVLGLLLVIGFTFCWIEKGYATEEGQELIDVPTTEEIAGEASDVEESENKQQKHLVPLAGKTKTLTWKKFNLMVTDGEKTSVPVPIANSNYTISYVSSNKEVILHEGKTTVNGEILNIPVKQVPSEIESIRIRYTLGEASRGFVNRTNKLPYKFTFTKTIAKSTTIDSTVTTKFGNATDVESPFYNFHATRINYFFDQSIREVQAVSNTAKNVFLGMTPISIKPINIYFEKGYLKDKRNGFSRVGYNKDGMPCLNIADKKTRLPVDTYLKHNVMHEWMHWNMFQANGMPGERDYYDGHSGYNPDPQTSYKEGFALVLGDMFARNYDLKSEDMLVQTNNNNRNEVLGISTNNTVKGVLYDLLDILSEDEVFSISNRYIEGPLTELNQRKMNVGVLITLMKDSKATTLQGLLNYYEKKYVLTKADQQEFRKLLAVNGLTNSGEFSRVGKIQTVRSQEVFSDESDMEDALCEEE